MKRKRVIRNFLWLLVVGLVTFIWGWFRGSFWWGEDIATNILWCLTIVLYFPSLFLIEQSPKLISLPTSVTVPLYIVAVLVDLFLWAVFIEVVESLSRRVGRRKMEA